MKTLTSEAKRTLKKSICRELIEKHRMSNTIDTLIPIIKKKRRLFNKRLKLRTIIEDFYLENSTIDPGKKVTVTINRKKVQKQYLQMSIIDLLDKFNNTREKKVSYTLFANYRPKQCIFPKVTARDTCACLQHENMILLIKYLSSKNIIPENSHYKLTKLVTCKKSKLDCFSIKCQDCCNKKIILNLNEGRKIHVFKKWITSKEKRISEKTGKEIIVTIAKKEELSLSYEELEKYFEEEFANFMTHLHTHLHQSRAAKNLKSSLGKNEAVILIDFSENYQCKYGTEVQSVHFGASRSQITIHSGMLYTSEGSRGFATMSDSLKHDNCAVAAHLEETLIKLTSEGHSKDDTVHFIIKISVCTLGLPTYFYRI